MFRLRRDRFDITELPPLFFGRSRSWFERARREREIATPADARGGPGHKATWLREALQPLFAEIAAEEWEKRINSLLIDIPNPINRHAAELAIRERPFYAGGVRAVDASVHGLDKVLGPALLWAVLSDIHRRLHAPELVCEVAARWDIGEMLDEVRRMKGRPQLVVSLEREVIVRGSESLTHLTNAGAVVAVDLSVALDAAQHVVDKL